MGHFLGWTRQNVESLPFLCNECDLLRHGLGYDAGRMTDDLNRTGIIGGQLT